MLTAAVRVKSICQSKPPQGVIYCLHTPRDLVTAAATTTNYDLMKKCIFLLLLKICSK